MSQKVIIIGATGSIGKIIAEKLIARGDEVTIFSRSAEKAKSILPNAHHYVEWNAYEPGDWQKSIDGKDAVIHLAGTPLIGELWDDEYKAKVKKSRVEGTRNIANAILQSNEKPKVFVSASAIGFYGPSKEKAFVESDKPGNGFLSEVCEHWEIAAAEVEKAGVRRVSVRVGVVLDKDEGALKKLLDFYENYLGGIVGDGRQWVSWIHLNDAANLFIFALDNENVGGAINAVAPNPVRMKELTETLSKITEKPAWLKIPKLIFDVVLGDASVPVNDGIKVFPERTLSYGYNFQFENFKNAMDDLIR